MFICSVAVDPAAVQGAALIFWRPAASACGSGGSKGSDLRNSTRSLWPVNR